MKRVFMALGVCLLSLGLAVGDAEAKRLGGGKSTGMQRDSVTQKQATPPAQNSITPSAPAAAPAAATAPKRNWLGPLAGLAAGLGIAALLSHLGMGEGLANALMIGLLVVAVVLVFKLLFRRKAPPLSGEAMEYAGVGGPGMAPSSSFEAAQSGSSSATGDVERKLQCLDRTEHEVPADFDSEGFLRVAKLNFLRLQAANDAGNLEDIREFVSPELFAEIRLQFDERNKAPQQTDVVILNAQLLDLATETGRHVASVRFSGMIREEAEAAAEPFDEVWNLTKPIEGGKGWVVAGIQQLAGF
ncbi:TIM44-like domain-containing protein [Accumulibacter sp.]|uniref:Tim44 domain-containing protein n=1 Tax=Accumulibacter sp. TaxID=2053492 RepID=UPI0026350D5D|nr:TIM44-like domain-containing protein [Accumulibacter sp.]